MRLESKSIGLAALGLFAVLSQTARAEAVIAGTVQAKEECAHAPMEAWLSSGSTLLYQVEIPQKGSFEFHVNSGPYDLVAVGSSGCMDEVEVEARENDTRIVTLRPSPALTPPKTEKHSALDLSWLLPSAWAETDCPTCSLRGRNTSPLNLAPDEAPWWLGYGTVSYPNFALPAAWSGGGVDGKQYAGQGGLFALRPVVYFNGPDGTPIKIQPQLADATHWLVTVPRPVAGAWRGTIQNNQFKTEDATYRDIFYDYRGDQKKFQDSRGFCAGRGELVPKLAAALRASGFKPNEIADFSSYWRFKIPQSERYCVYPQSSAELQPSVRLEIEPKPQLFTQLLFIVQTGENLDGKGKFRRAPVATWKAGPTEQPREPAASLGPQVQVREWGMSFLEGQREGQRP